MREGGMRVGRERRGKREFGVGEGGERVGRERRGKERWARGGRESVGRMRVGPRERGAR